AGGGGGAAGQERHGLGRPAVVAQGREQRVAAEQVVAAQVEAHEVAAAIARDNRVIQRGRQRARVLIEDAAAVLPGGVAADGAIGQRDLAEFASHAAATDPGGVAADGASGQRDPAAFQEQAGATGAAEVAADGAIGQGGNAIAEPAAAVEAAGVAADGASGQRGPAGVFQAAAGGGGGAADGASGQGGGAVVGDAAALAEMAGVAAGDRQPRDRRGDTSVDSEHAAGMVAADGQQVRARARDGLRPGLVAQLELTLGQG